MTKKQTDLALVLAVLPPEMQSLVRLATGPNTTIETQIEVAKAIVYGTPIFQLQKLVFIFISGLSNIQEEHVNG